MQGNLDGLKTEILNSIKLLAIVVFLFEINGFCSILKTDNNMKGIILWKYF